MIRLAAVIVLIAAAPAAAQEESVWSGPARDAYARAEAAHARFVYARHDPDRPVLERQCMDYVATRAGALVRMLETRAELGRIPPWAIADTHRQLDELSAFASDVCARTRESEGETELHVGRSVFAQLMPRDRAILRVGARFEMVPRVRFAGYALLPWMALVGSFGGFVVPWLRVEAIGLFSYMVAYGAYGQLGARAMVTAPWSLLRLGVGLAVSAVLAQDRLANVEFGWLGIQIEIPLELGFEVTKDFGLSVIGGPMYTQPGSAPASWRGISGSIALTAEFLL